MGGLVVGVEVDDRLANWEVLRDWCCYWVNGFSSGEAAS